MISIDRFESLMDQVVNELPSKLFDRLNLGVGLVEHSKSHNRTASGQAVFILGEYHVRPNLGRGIVLYYGSFARVYPYIDNEAEALPMIRDVIKHELTHHLESLAGERDLIIDDVRQLLGM